jgi:hypothetical protein
LLKLENKRIFIGLQIVSLMFLGGLLFILWSLYFNKLNLLNRVIVVSILGIFLIVMLIVLLGIGGIILTILSKRTYTKLENMMRISIELLNPLAMYTARLFKIDIDKVRRSFIEVNNHLVSTDLSKINNDKLLILAPHCLQNSDCQFKITYDINNCRSCGKCSIESLKEIAATEKVHVAVCTGGTMARSIVKKIKPSAIVAIACERDLTSGIQDSSGLPVMGIINDRPNGPCFDTKVDIEELKDKIQFFLKED